jgi:hypothetical protein
MQAPGHPSSNCKSFTTAASTSQPGASASRKIWHARERPTAADKQLNNETFLSNPYHIVDGLPKQSTETRILYDKTKAALDALGD